MLTILVRLLLVLRPSLASLVAFWSRHKNNLQHASGNIDELLNRRTTAIERTLRHIELSEGEPALDLLHFQEDEEEYED